MAAAIEASTNKNNEIILFERHARVGRKLQATGNGRCNLSNVHAQLLNYHGQNPEFVKNAFQQFGVENTLKWFADLGLFTVTEDSGRVYPYSDQANSVVDVLRFGLDQSNVCVSTATEIQKVKRQDNGFLLDYGEGTVLCDRLIVACGGLAGTKLGGSMAGYKILTKLGHKCSRLRPALVQIKSDWPEVVSLKGVRTNCNIKILKDEELFSQSSGELQFTEYGLSGPVIFEVSRDVCAEPGNWTAEIDFLPHVSSQQLYQELLRRKQTCLPQSEILTGILHNRLGRVLTQMVGVGGTSLVCNVHDELLRQICTCVKSFRISLTEPLGMENAQVTAGGILTEQFNSATLESKIVPGLFACGEVLDIDGDCGGYNLQWAWSSGRLAGMSAGKE